MKERSVKSELPENAKSVPTKSSHKQRRARAEAGMMGPVWVGVLFLAVVCIGLAYFLLNPMW